MKRIICCSVLFIVIITLSSYINAYSTSKYSIDIPTTYYNVSEGAFTKKNGDNINIQISSYSSGAPSYNKDTLNKFEEILKTQISSEKDAIVRILRKKNEEYGLSLTEEQINEYASSFKINSMEKKELTTCSKNKYNAYHFIVSYSMGEYSFYIEQYYIVTKTDLYIISIGSNDKSSFKSTETTNMINSFTILNYEEPSSFFFSSDMWTKVITTTIVTIIFVGIKNIFNKNKVQEDEVEDIKNDKKDIEDEELNVLIKNIEKEKKNDSTVEDKENNNKKYCTKCGKTIDEEWTFCNYCANKLK